MSNGNHMKGLKVSKEVHEELSIRKHRGESFDEVLKRVLGLVPRTIEDLTAMLPDRLAMAANSIVKDYINKEDRYRRIGRRDGEKLTLKFVSRDSNKGIFEVCVYLPKGGERVNHRVDIYYRNPQNGLKRIAQLRDIEDDAVDITEYTDFDTREIKETTRQGDNAGQKTADEVVGPEVAQFVEQAYTVWGEMQTKAKTNEVG